MTMKVSDTMKRKLIVSIFVIMIVLLLQGCSGTKNETELMTDLQACDAFCLPDGVTAGKISIIKRLTDDKNKTDKVYVQLEVQNAVFHQTRAYVMDYTHYNEGWMLDNVEEYWEDDFWAVTPKIEPDENLVLEELIEWSNSSIQASYEWAQVESPMQGSMFFEEGKFSATFSEKNLEGSYYKCLVSVTRPFEYVICNEDIMVTLAIDPYDYSWELVAAESVDLSVDQCIARSWISNGNDAIYFSKLERDNNIFTMSGADVNGYSVYDVELELCIPSFEQILPSTAIIDHYDPRGTIYGEISLWPDGMWITDRDGETEKFVGEIETCYAGSKTTEKYAEFGKEWLESIYIEHDIDRFIGMIHPSRQPEFRDMEIPDWETAPTLDGVGYCNLSLCFVKGYFETEFSYEIMEHLRELGCNTDNISTIGSLEMEFTLEGEQTTMHTLVIEENGCIYTLGD